MRYNKVMILKEFNQTYFSDGIEIRSLRENDIPLMADLWKNSFSKEYIDKVTDEEIINSIVHFVRKDIFGFSAIYLILKNNNFIGYFTIWFDDTIRFRINDCKKGSYNFGIHFIEEISNYEISACIGKFIEALLYFKINIKTIYAFKTHNERFINNLRENNFAELEPGIFYSKLGDSMEKKGINNDYKTSNIFLKRL
jgi:hypothetical protein